MPSCFKICRVKRLGLLLFLALLAQGLSAELLEKPRLTLIGHATVLLEGSEATFLTDPFFKPKMLWLKRQLLASAQPQDLPPIDAVLISHTHPDHFDRDAILALNPKPVIVMPWGRGKTLRDRGFQVVDLRPGESWTCKNAKITAVYARHNAWHNLGYLIEMDGKKLYFTGDTKLFPGLAKLTDESIDMMLMPYDGTRVIGNIWTMDQAAEAVKTVQPKICVPIHWGTLSDWLTGKTSTPPEVFAERVKAVSPETRFILLRPGDSAPLSDPSLLPHEPAR
jgi:L-ascorbate metabolism protein UlaG (beta-lactamase superfamily)